MERNLSHAHLSTRNIKMFILSSDFIYHSMNICKKNGFWSNAMFLLTFENFQICSFFGSPFAPVFPWFGISCYVDSGTHYIRLDSSRLFYLRKFSFVVHSKCFFLAFCMSFEAKFTEVKQARWVKPEFTCTWIYVTILSMSMLWLVARHDRKK